MIDRILSFIGILGISVVWRQVQGNYADSINLHDPKAKPIASSGIYGGGDSCILQSVLDLTNSYDSAAGASAISTGAGAVVTGAGAVATGGNGVSVTGTSSKSADENIMESNAHIYSGHYQKDDVQNIRLKSLSSQSTVNSTSKALAYPPNKGEILVHRPAAIVVKRPPTKVIVNHPPLVVKPPPVVLHKPPAVVVRKVYVKQHPRPVKVEPVYVNVVKPPAEKYFVDEKHQLDVHHQHAQHQQLQLQQHQAEPLSTDILYEPLTGSANSNVHAHNHHVETMPSPIQLEDAYYHTISADNTQLHRLLHINDNNDGSLNYDTVPSISPAKMQNDGASSY